MCGRYYIDDTTAREVEKAVGRLDGKLDMTCGDVLPSRGAAVLRGQRGRLTADVMTWGFPGIDKGKLLINARAESALEKKTFRESMLHRRCIIPARGFYEWCQGPDWEAVVDRDTDALLRCASSGQPLFCRPLGQMRPPVLLLGSREDPMCRLDLEAEYTAMAAQIPSASVCLFPSGGHPAVLTRAEDAARAVLAFLTERE